MNNVLNKLKFTDKLFNIMYEAKEKELTKVCEEYSCTLEEFKETLRSELIESRMNLGACNTALDFLIVATSNGEIKRNLRTDIRDNILGSAIYYANILGYDPN